MNLFLFGQRTPALRQVQHQLIASGYSATLMGDRPSAGVPNDQQRRNMLMRMISDCDAVAIPPGLMTSAQLARLAVVCEFAGKRLVLTDHLPPFAPDDVKGLDIYAVRTPVRCTWTAEETPAPVVSEAPRRLRLNEVMRRTRCLLHHLEQRGNRFLGKSLKNPQTRHVRYPDPPGASTTG